MLCVRVYVLCVVCYVLIVCLRRAPERSEGVGRLTRRANYHRYLLLRARSARLLRRAPKRSEGARRLTRRGLLPPLHLLPWIDRYIYIYIMDSTGAG